MIHNKNHNITFSLFLHIYINIAKLAVAFFVIVGH